MNGEEEITLKGEPPVKIILKYGIRILICETENQLANLFKT